MYPFDPVINAAGAGRGATRWVSGQDLSAPETQQGVRLVRIRRARRFLGTIDLPSWFAPTTVRHDRIYALQSDDLGVQTMSGCGWRDSKAAFGQGTVACRPEVRLGPAFGNLIARFFATVPRHPDL